MKNNLWVEKYRPNTIDGYVFVDERMREQVTNWISTGSMPHLLLSGEAGVGKTTLAKILINELGVEEYDVMTINASRENGVDTIREKITGFVSTMPFGKFKVVLLDECLDEDTLVHVIRDGKKELIKIKDVSSETDLVQSYDLDKKIIEWLPFVKMDKGTQDVYDLEFENGETVVCTGSHKWYVRDSLGQTKVVRTDELTEFMHILTP